MVEGVLPLFSSIVAKPLILQCFNFFVGSFCLTIEAAFTAGGGRTKWSTEMNIPAIDPANIPGLDTATGIFGSVSVDAASSGDKVVAIMVYIYETVPPSAVV